MNRVNNELIEALADDLPPVRAMHFGEGMLLLGTAAGLTAVAVSMIYGLREAAFSGAASPYFYIVNGLLVLLGIASAASVISMALPRVGNRHDGPRWAMAMVGILPVAALISLFAEPSGLAAFPAHEWVCTTRGLAASLLTAGALFFWLRRGAPVSAKAAGLHLGVASGALGSAAYGLHCPIDGVAHLGILHIAPVLITALVGRFALPRLLRW
jgi:hypothetical protein